MSGQPKRKPFAAILLVSLTAGAFLPACGDDGERTLASGGNGGSSTGGTGKGGSAPKGGDGNGGSRAGSAGESGGGSGGEGGENEGGESGDGGTTMTGGSGGSGGRAGSGGSGGRAGGAGSGGRAGGAGSGGRAGGAGSGGRGGMSGGGSGGGNTRTDCVECHPTCSDVSGFDFVAYCFEAMGNARGGGAAGVPLAELCGDVLACIFRTECGATTYDFYHSCYCGQDSMGMDKFCEDGISAPTGPCKREFEWAAESAAQATVSDRMSDTAYALGRAGQLLDCYMNTCTESCFPSAQMSAY